MVCFEGSVVETEKERTEVSELRWMRLVRRRWERGVRERRDERWRGERRSRQSCEGLQRECNKVSKIL